MAIGLVPRLVIGFMVAWLTFYLLVLPSDEEMEIHEYHDPGRDRLVKLYGTHRSPSPFAWSKPAVNPHDYDQVLARMKYWKGTDDLIQQPNPFDKYLTFTVDCGGFNNIRMGFEHNVIMAWLTRRTLVLPPPAGWYLIDWGPFARDVPQNQSGVTDYSEFFNITALHAAVPVISTHEFIAREKDRLHVPQEFHIQTEFDFDTRNHYHDWQITQNWHHAWGLLSNILYYPDIATVEQKAPPPASHVSNREKIEYSQAVKDQIVMYFPSCYHEKDKPEGDHYRWLGQVAAIAAYDDAEQAVSMKRMLRNHVRYPDIVFEVAARVVPRLGMFQYSAVHIRRNDLQYKGVFISAQETLDHIRPLLNKSETLYLSTDETEDGFFAAIEKEFPVYRWDDFLKPGGKGGEVLAGLQIPRKLIGITEQAICMMGRTFFGTRASTFSGYITRLRGYVNAPDTNIYFHNTQYSGDPEKDKGLQPPVGGQEYMTEDNSMWLLKPEPAGPPFPPKQ